MRIDPQLPGQVPTRQVQVPPGNSREPASARTGQPGASGHIRSAELQQLADELQRTPEVRAEAVNRARERVESGYYRSTEAAQKTAEVMVGSVE